MMTNLVHFDFYISKPCALTKGLTKGYAIVEANRPFIAKEGNWPNG